MPTLFRNALLAATLLLQLPAFAGIRKMTLRQAMSAHAVDVHVSAAGGYIGQTVQLDLINTSCHDLDLTIEPGMIFTPVDSRYQHLVVVGDEHLFVRQDDTARTKLYGFCGKSHTASPARGIRYRFWKQGDAVMVNVLRYIRNKKLYDHLGQHAVWTLTSRHQLTTVFDRNRPDQSRDFVNYIAALRGVKAPDFFVQSHINTSGSGPMAQPDLTKAYIDLRWNMQPPRNLHVLLLRKDGSIYKEILDGEKISAGDHWLTVLIDARRVPEGDYLLCLRDDDNTVYARRYVSVEDGKAAAWQM